jgi:hypothetical protein
VITEIDREFGDMIREARVKLDMPQPRLARLMSRHGFAWQQSTVSKAELAQRPVSVGEAATLAVLLRLDVNLRDLGVKLPPCPVCLDSPPAGFTCQMCDAKGDAPDEGRAP